MNVHEQTQATLELMKAAQTKPSLDLMKAWEQSSVATTGITFYDLEAPSKKLYPVITPLRNSIPRVSGRGGIQANWKAITGINTTKVTAGVSQGNRGGVVTTATAEYNAIYRGIGLEDYVTFEAQYAGQGFEDVKALAVTGLLQSTMIQEELVILGGNGAAVAMGTTPTPTCAAVTTGGTLADATYSVICVAMTHQAYMSFTVAGGLTGQVSRTNADGSVDTFGGGCARKSAAGTAVLSGGSNLGRVTATVAAVTGAVAYAWYWGTSGNELLGAITTINSINITAAAAGTQNASAMPTTDYSQNSLYFDGLLYQAWKSGSGAYIKTMATGTAGTGTALTGDGVGGVVEIDQVLKYLWDTWRLSPTRIWCNSQENQNITAKVLAGSASFSSRFNITVNDQSMIAGGIRVKSYLNKFGMGGVVDIPIDIHPNMPAGTMFFDCDMLPYPLSGVPTPKRMLTRQEYYQMEWPLRTRKYEYGVYADEVLQNYAPFSNAIITNIANG